MQRRLSLALYRFSEVYPSNANLSSTDRTFHVLWFSILGERLNLLAEKGSITHSCLASLWKVQ
jgi:hypothetical protein